jgi:alpha-tubulin suppressor-like RCC1 family protein
MKNIWSSVASRRRAAAVLGLRLIAFIALLALTPALGAAAPVASTVPPNPVFSWGGDHFGELGIGRAQADQNAPVQVQNLAAATAIAAKGYHSVALAPDGTVWTFGFNASGQLGDGTTTNASLPVQVLNLTGITAIASGRYHTLALASDGTVWTWGQGGFGQLGNGATSDSSVPVQVSNLTGVIAIAGGAYHSLALKSDGTVWAWGDNSYGELGDGTTTAQLVPVQVQNLTGVTAIAAGNWHTLAIKSDGTAWAWGRNSFGQLGITSTTSKSTLPRQVTGLTGVIAIAGGQFHTIAVTSDNTAWVWGFNGDGELGDGSTTNSYVPVHVLRGNGTPLSGVVSVAAGDDHCLALISDGSVWSWGGNSHGQLGRGVFGKLPSRPALVVNISGVTAIQAGAYFSLAIAP